MHRRIGAAVVISALFGLSASARAETIELQPIDAGQVDSTGFHDRSGYQMVASEGLGLRSFLVFDVSAIEGTVVDVAWKVVGDPTSSGSLAEVRAVSTPGTTFIGGFGSFTDPAVYDDLGSGGYYVAAWLNANGGTFALSPAAVTDLNAASSTFVLGIASSGAVFDGGYASLLDLINGHALVIETAPEPLPSLGPWALGGVVLVLAATGAWMVGQSSRRRV